MVKDVPNSRTKKKLGIKAGRFLILCDNGYDHDRKENQGYQEKGNPFSHILAFSAHYQIGKNQADKNIIKVSQNNLTIYYFKVHG